MNEELNEADLSDEDDRMEVEDKTKERKEAIKDVFTKHKMIKSYVFDKKGEWCSFVITRKTTDERVDLVEVIASAVQQIKIQGEGPKSENLDLFQFRWLKIVLVRCEMGHEVLRCSTI